MIQRILALVFILLSGISHAESAGANAKAIAIKKSPEASLQDGLTCLKRVDIPCAHLALATIPSQSPYAKLLSGNIAAAERDFDTVFRLLLPLQANNALVPPARASLHASLALAYENLPDPLHALEQLTTASGYLADVTEIQALHDRTWKLLSSLANDQLIEMRGESLDTTIQGWIDLAIIANTNPSNREKLLNWKSAYPDHPATAIALSQAEPTPGKSMDGSNINNHQPALAGKIALLLPFSSEAYYPIADAIERGFEAAHAAAGSHAEIMIYSTSGSRDGISAIYAQALADGATQVVGPLTQDEVTALAATEVKTTTLALNSPENPVINKNLYFFGLSVENEAEQIAKLARASGLQVAAIVGTMSATSLRMAKSFGDAWVKGGGQVTLQARLNKDTDTSALKAQIAEHADMILIAGNADDARKIRPLLDITMPTFGFSKTYSGIRHESSDNVLAGIGFTDFPWMLAPDEAAYSAYKDAAAGLPQGEMQRWFAVGADAYQILLAISSGESTILHGLTGKIHVSRNSGLSRELAIGRFAPSGIMLEKMP